MINRAKNIKYNAADNVLVMDSMTTAIQNNINMWFEPFMDEINDKDGVFIVYFNSEDDNTVTLGVSDNELHAKAIAHARTHSDFP